MVDSRQGVLKKAEKVLSQPVCDHCLGRQFAQLTSGRTDEERGKALRDVMAFRLDAGEDLDVDVSNFSGYTLHLQEEEVEEDFRCSVCKGIFEVLDLYAEDAMEELEDWEYGSFLVGTKMTDDLVGREEELWERVGIEWTEQMKAEINREVGSIIEQETGKEVEFTKPDILVLLDLESEGIELEVNSIYIYGEYEKHSRTLPQTKWPGGEYDTSVEEIVAEPFMEATDGSGHKFHGMGREDIDAKCLAGRPFILEILEPRKRDLKVLSLQQEVNTSRRVRVKNMQAVGGDLVEEIKSVQPDKTYRVTVTTNKELDPETIREVRELAGREIHQETPNRVLQRRADKLRKREIKKVTHRRKSARTVRLWIRAEAGTYIKELVTGDDGRTYPSVAEKWGCDVRVKELDVTEIHWDRSEIGL